MRIDGEADLRRQLSRVTDRIDGVLADAAKAAAGLVREEAARLAPVRTGKLRRSMTLDEPERERRKVSLRVGPAKEAFYGLFVERGAMRETGYLAPRPFLRPALASKRRQAMEAAGEVIRRALRRAGKGG